MRPRLSFLPATCLFLAETAGAELSLPSYLWSCQGDVWFTEAPGRESRRLEEREEEMMLRLPPGSGLRIPSRRTGEPSPSSEPERDDSIRQDKHLEKGRR